MKLYRVVPADGTIDVEGEWTTNRNWAITFAQHAGIDMNVLMVQADGMVVVPVAQVVDEEEEEEILREIAADEPDINQVWENND